LPPCCSSRCRATAALTSALYLRAALRCSGEERVALEEKLEQYAFKLRIAERKGRDQKVVKLLGKVRPISGVQSRQ
jgi:hypothetical protein